MLAVAPSPLEIFRIKVDKALRNLAYLEADPALTRSLGYRASEAPSSPNLPVIL